MYTDSWAAQSGLDLKGAALEDRRVGGLEESHVYWVFPNEPSVRIAVFHEAAHQRLVAASDVVVLNNEMNRSTFIYKG